MSSSTSGIQAAGAPEVPATLDELLRPSWLSAALDRRFPGVKVTSAALGPVISRVSTNARFHIEGEGGLPRGLPADLCAKGYFVDNSSRQAGEPEAFFYRDLAEGAGVRTLRSVYADVDRDTHHGVVITEDVVAQGAIFLDSLSPYSPDQAAESLRQYAILHGRTWDAPALEQYSWLAPRLDATLRARGLPEIEGNFNGPIGSGVPAAARDAARLVEAARALPVATRRRTPWCLIHGDAHVGNIYLDGQGRPCLLDWQLVQRGPWFIDIGYHIASALAVADRRTHERDLLTHYLDCLAAEGVDVPSWDDAWEALCVGMVYGFFLWGVTLKVKPPITTALLERLGTAVADHDAFAVVLSAE